MSNPALNDKKFEEIRDEWMPGFAAADSPAELTAVDGAGTAAPRVRPQGAAMTANGTFAKTAMLFVLVLAGATFGWSQTPVSPTGELQIPGWSWIALFGAFAVAIVCCFKPKLAPILGPIYAITEGVFLGVISKAFESQWNGIVFQAILAVIGVFTATLFLYVTGIVKVTRKFQMMVIGATIGIVFLYLAGALLSLFGVDVVFWNDPTPIGIIISVVICCVAALNLFLDYEFIRQNALAGAPKYMEWFGAFGLMVTLVWLYLEVLRLLSLLRQ
ncbi:MAG: Bax inhibitor-1/YccA family protein [Acidimicrobiia bacterium]